MLCQAVLMLEGFVAFIALERFFACVGLHVALQNASCNASIVALVTFEWLFPCVVPHHVVFQMTSCDTGKLAHCASVGLFPRVGPFVILQIAWLN